LKDQEYIFSVDDHCSAVRLHLDSPSGTMDQIQKGSVQAVIDLYWVLRQQLLPYFQRAGHRSDSEDSVHDVFVEVLRSIHSRRIRQADRLMGFVWAVAHHQKSAARRRSSRITNHASETVLPAPQERAYLDQEVRVELLIRIAELPPVDRQILTLFYLDEMPWQSICSELGLTATQFRLRKHRAKSRL
jgi:RNA polymerase sigma factor (sigma-70 family)